MAKVLWGAMVGDVRGKLGGDAFSRNRSGAYVRKAPSPVNPNTQRQQEQRSAMTQAVQYWRDTCTAAQRAAWLEYAQATPLVDGFGLKQTHPGNVMFVRYNSVMIRQGKAVVAAAPVTGGEAPMIIPTITGSTAAGIQVTAMTPTLLAADWIQVQIGNAASSQSVNFFGGPFTHRAFDVGNVALPWLLKAGGELGIGQRWWLRFRAFLSDGKTGPPSTFYVDINA